MTTASSSPGPTPQAELVKSAIAGAVSMIVLMGLGRFSYTPILPGMMEELSMSAAAAGSIASANYLGYLTGAVLAGFGWGTGSERRVALASVAASVVLLLAMALAESILVFSAIRFLAGLASAFGMIFTSAIVLTRGQAAGTPHIQSAHFGGVGVGMALSAVMVGLIAALGYGWAANWYAGAFLGAIGYVVMVVLLPDGPVRVGKPQREKPLALTGRWLATTIAYGIFGFGYVITATFLVTIVRNNDGGVTFESLVWLVAGLAAAPSVAYWHPVARRFGLARTFVAGCLVEAVGVAASVLLPLPAGPLIGGLLLGGTFVMVTAYGLQIGREMAPQSQRRALAFMTTGFGIGQMAGPIVAGYLADLTGSFLLASLSGVAALLIAAVMMALVVRTR